MVPRAARRVNMRPHHRQLFVSFMILIFVMAASLALAIAFGVRLDRNDWRFVRTGTLVVSANPMSADVLVDGQLVRSRTPTTIRTILPGPHRVQIREEGFVGWEKSLTITAGRTTYVVGTVLARQPNPAVTAVSVPAAQVGVRPDQRQLAIRTTSGKVQLVDTTGAVDSEPVTPALSDLWSWSPYGRFLVGRTESELVVIEPGQPTNVQRFPLPANVDRWIWNQQTETLGYILTTDRRVTAYDLLTSNHRELAFVTADIAASGQLMRTIEPVNLEQTSWQLVTRQGPLWEAVRRQPLAQPVEAFLGQRSDVLLLGQTSGLIVWQPESAVRFPFTDTPRGASWSTHGQLLVWTETELWTFDNDQLHNPQLLGRFGTIPGPVSWLPHGDAFLRREGEALMLEELDVRGEHYRVPLFTNAEASQGWLVHDTDITGISLVDGRLVLNQLTALPRVGGGR